MSVQVFGAQLAGCQFTEADLAAWLAGLAPLGFEVNGNLERTLPHVINFSLSGTDSEALMVALRELVAISNGSACTSSSYSPSHVLTAMGFSQTRVQGATRWSWCHLTPEPDWMAIVERISRLRADG